MSTTDLRHPSSGMRSYLRRRFGLWPLHELKNRVLLGPKTPALRRFEDGEVARLLSVLGGVQRAACATIVPTYRRPELLKVAVESALSQTMDDNIVMVVDDGGGLPALPDHPRLRAVSLSRNTAVLGLVRNVGIRLTDSDFIAFLDDDNQWKPNHLHTAITALRGHDSEAVGPPPDAVYTAVERRMPDGVLLDTLSKPFDRAEFADQSSLSSTPTRSWYGVTLASTSAVSRASRRRSPRRIGSSSTVSPRRAGSSTLPFPQSSIWSTPTAITPRGSPDLGQLAHAARCGAWLP